MLGWRFWGKFFNMAQGAAQFYRRSAFDAVCGYDETIYMGEDIEFYWRVSKFARQNRGHFRLIDEPRVVTSTRRFDNMSIWRTLLLAHPIFIRLAWRKRFFWKDWYDEPVR
jgi:predicted glycosyltransferase involved in capsule biosynthesis